MTPGGYFGTGVALGVLIGVFAGFMAAGILRSDTSPGERDGIDAALDRMGVPDEDDQRLDRAPADLWNASDDAKTALPPTAGENEKTGADGEEPTEDAPAPTGDDADDPYVHGQQDLPDWPDAKEGTDAEVRTGDDDADEAEETGPTPGGARLPKDPDASFDAPED